MHQVPSTESLRSLVPDGRVHSRRYTDPAIFELEIERIFHSSWVYVGHESEVRKPGDYQTRLLGRTPVLMVRGKDNRVRVLVNRCRHRGAQVVEYESGIGAMHRENPFSDEALTRTRDYGHGHAMLDFRAQRLKSYKKHAEFLAKIPGGAKYVEDMHKAHGERAELLISLSGDPHLGIFPNLQLIGNQVRIITPIAPGLTQVTMQMVRLGGVSDEINTLRVRQHESFYGPAGSGSPDDAEIFERVQRGMAAEVNPWIEISRGMHREEVDPVDGSIVGRITDEVPQRGQMKFWLQLMTQAG
jgi:hypothetical protein